MATRLSKMKTDYGEELRWARESIRGEVKKVVEAAVVEAKK